MTRGFRASSWLFYGLSGFMTLVIIASFIAALSWINRPYPGYLVYDFPLVGSMSMEDWPGRRAGLVFLERVVSVNGHPIWKGRDVYRIVREESPGILYRYELGSKAERRELAIPSTVFTGWDFFMVFFLTFAGGATVFCLGFVVYLLKPRVKVSWVFFLLCLFLSLYMVTSFEIQSTYLFTHFHYLALCFMSPFFLHLGLIFPDRKRFLNRFGAVEYVIYLPAILFAVGYQIYLLHFVEILQSDALRWLPSYKAMGLVNRMFLLFCIAGLISLIIHTFVRGSTNVARQRARMILFGVTIAFGPPVVLMLLSPFVKVNFPWNFLVFFVIVFPASIAYSIAKHNLFDADTIIRRTVGYAVVTAVVIGAYAVVSLGLNVLVGKYEMSHSPAFPILFTLGVILVFNPLRDRIQAVVDRLFFRKEYDYGKIVDKIGAAMTSVLDQGEILKRLMRTFIEDIFINTSSILLFQPATAQYLVSLVEGERREDLEQKSLRRDKPLVQIIERERKELTIIDVQEDPKYKEVSVDCAMEFEGLHATLMVPLVFKDQVIGLMSLGEKKSGKAFSREDVDLLRTLANQSAVALENARLFQENLEKQRMEEELNIARDLQMSMLPATCPQIPGFGIAATSIPAREVGGDFFDFITMGDRKLGLVIGDVTGKSVSGALVMSSSRSVFRMLSEQDLGVGDIMVRANRRMKKDIKSGMFVALLYAVLDVENRALSLCSAGQTQPMLFSATTGKISLVETEGDTFPIGILDEADYKDTSLQLAPGDRCVFYTDGIVEATNQNKEIFGFERLQEVIQRSGYLSAEALLKEILERVNEFVGNAPQHDDLTAIVISVSGSS
jgi:phosphoserine phosphatase RsbU/P